MIFIFCFSQFIVKSSSSPMQTQKEKLTLKLKLKLKQLKAKHLKMDSQNEIVKIFQSFGIDLGSTLKASLKRLEHVKVRELLNYLSLEGVQKPFADGLYYKYVEGDFKKAEICFQDAIKIHDCALSMNCLGLYYKNKNKKINKMKEYFKMAIEKGCVKSMYSLGFYYFTIRAYPLMKLYFEMAIKKGCVKSMNGMGHYYKNVMKDYNKMKSYYGMAIDCEYQISMNNLGYYFKQIEKDDVQANKYFLMAISHNKKLTKTKAIIIEKTKTKDVFNNVIVETTNNLELKTKLKVAIRLQKMDWFDEMIKKIYEDDMKIDEELFNILKDIDTEIFKLPNILKQLIQSWAVQFDLLQTHFKQEFEKAKTEILTK